MHFPKNRLILAIPVLAILLKLKCSILLPNKTSHPTNTNPWTIFYFVIQPKHRSFIYNNLRRFEVSNHIILNQLLQRNSMSIQEKQTYLREHILEKQINPSLFEEYWENLNVDIQHINMNQLEDIVHQFFNQFQQQHSEEFTDFQGPEEHPEIIKQQYTGYNWDFLITKSDQPKKQIISEKNNQKQKQLKRMKLESTLPRQSKAEDLMEELDEGKSDNKKFTSKYLNENSNPKEEKSMTVREVLESSKLTSIKCLKLQENILSHHNNVEINITSLEEIQDKFANSIINKFIKTNSILFNIQTIGRNKTRAIGVSWEVKRKHLDFQWLKNTLIKFYPGVVVPPLPSPVKNKQKIMGYQKKLQNFLMDCYRSPELRNSKYFEVFLSYVNTNDFEGFVKKTEAMQKPQSLNHILNMKGNIQILHGQNIEIYSYGLQNYLKQSSDHLKQVKSILNEINDSYQKISSLYKDLSSLFLLMSEQSHAFSDQKCFQRLSRTYKEISSLTNDHSNFCEGEKDSVDAFMKSHFAYQKDRMDNLQNLISKKIAFSAQLNRRISKGETSTEKSSGMFSKLSSLFGQKSQSIDIPSANYETLSLQVGYYNNQLLKESVRCIEVAIQSHIVHFSGYGISRIDNVDRMQKIWSGILVELSKLNLNN